MYARDLDSTTITFAIEERVYKLERDEEAMLARLADANLKATGVDAFLYSRLGPMAELSGQEMTLSAVIDKKRVFLESKTLFKSEPTQIQNLFSSEPVAATPIAFRIPLTRLNSPSTIAIVQGSMRVCASDFTRMPKGVLTLKVAACS